MAKLKALRDDKDLAAVPLDEPVLVELEPAGAGPAVDVDPDEPEPPVRAKREPEDDDGAAALERQLAAAKEAERAANQRALQAEAEAERLKARGADAEKELLANELASAQAEEAAAQAELEKAFEIGDAKAMAAAQAKIGRAAAKIVNMEGAVAAQADDAKTQANAPAVDIVTAIDRDPKLMPAEKEWLKAHPEVLTDPMTNRELDVAYSRALREGHKRGTPAYFNYLNEFLGYETARKGDDGGTVLAAAPVSRDERSSTGRRITPTQVHLTPRQREMAALTGVSDAEYARGLLEMEAEKRANPEKFAAR